MTIDALLTHTEVIPPRHRLPRQYYWAVAI
jgi:hypothetical protein